MGETQMDVAEYYSATTDSTYLPASDTQDWCEVCNTPRSITSVHEEQAGYEEAATFFVVTDLSCGHEIVQKS